MKIAIINYGAGNLKSIQNALQSLNIDSFLANDPSELENAEKIILPGVGAAKSAMEKIERAGFREAIQKNRKPILGICLGLQLFSDFSYEEDTKCLGVIEGKVKLFPKFVKTPQIGWNKVNFVKDSPLFSDIQNSSYFYFVHSYYLNTAEEFILAKTDYGVSFPSVIQRGNFYATQFHPEKSGEIGLKLLNNFCTKC